MSNIIPITTSTLEILGLKQAADQLSISQQTLRRLISEGEIEFIQHHPKGKIFISQSALQQYLQCKSQKRARICHKRVTSKPTRSSRSTNPNSQEAMLTWLRESCA